ncbi:hypothetical protein [Streptomyces sp. NPDC060010]|uniref:hypothetical protein n=1 Tax=Streptomyces sp. NPDC060010 TaxID=3347036 RepID=UPI0036BC8300
MATEDENPSQPDITAMLKDQTNACKAARDAIAAGGEVMLYDGQPPQWIAADRSWFFTLYFDATGTELLACSGVKNERPSRGDGQKLQL